MFLAASQWSFASATEAAKALAAKEVSAVELAQHAIDRIERDDGKINAICVPDFDRGLARPKARRRIGRVKEAGGVVLGKTNVPLGLGDWQSYNDIYGTTNNPFDLG